MTAEHKPARPIHPDEVNDDRTLVDLDPANLATDDDELLADLAQFTEPTKADAKTAAASRSKGSARRSDPTPAPAAAANAAPEPAANAEVMDALGTMPLEIVAVLGRQKLTVKELSGLRSGSVVEFGKDPNDLVDLVAAGKTIGKGELVLVDGKLGVRIVKYF